MQEVSHVTIPCGYWKWRAHLKGAEMNVARVCRFVVSEQSFQSLLSHFEIGFRTTSILERGKWR